MQAVSPSLTMPRNNITDCLQLYRLARAVWWPTIDAHY